MLNDIFNILLPHITLAGFILLLLILGMILPVRMFKYSRLVSIVGISAAIVLLTTVQTEPQYYGFRNSIMSDNYTLLFDFIILVCGFLSALLSKKLIHTIKSGAYTHQALLLTAIFGAMSMVSANDFLTLFVSLELLSFSMYFLIASSKGYHSKEAAFKYLITSAISSGIFLFGASYIYGITGSLNFSVIYENSVNIEQPVVYSIGAILVVLGIISKIAVFPFANWILDVYKGCESSVLAFISSVPKLATFGILCRLLVFPFRSSFSLTVIIILLSLLTAFWANTYAIKEKNVKVILACSSAANVSYVLFAASIVSVYNLSTVIFYLICYAIMNIGAFAFLNIYGDKNPMNVSDFRGLFYKSYGLTIAYSTVILGLAGIPVTSGFISKIYLFSAIAKSGLIFIPLLVLLLLLIVVALFYYLKIILPLYEESEKSSNENILQAVFSQKFVIISSLVITVLIGICPEKLIELCQFIAYCI